MVTTYRTSDCPVGKNVEIKFKVEPENISLCEMYWQVTDTGWKHKKLDNYEEIFTHLSWKMIRK